MKTPPDWAVAASFPIILHRKDKPVLDKICKLLKVGRIYEKGPSSVEFIVFSIKELESVINHFEKFPLLTKKRADFNLFKSIMVLMKSKEHLTAPPRGAGLRKVVAIKAAMNLGLSEKLKVAFPDVVPVERPKIETPKTVDPQWLAGFTSGEGSFMIKIRASKTLFVGFQVIIVFQLTQHARDENLMKSFISFFQCGTIRKNRTWIDYRVTRLEDILNKIIPFFKKYPLRGVKALDFKDFCRAAELMKEKKHLTAPRGGPD